MFSLAERTDAAAIMPWELVPFHTTAGNYDFGIDDEAFGAVSQMVQYLRDKVCPNGLWPSCGTEPSCAEVAMWCVGDATDGFLREWRMPRSQPGSHCLYLL